MEFVRMGLIIRCVMRLLDTVGKLVIKCNRFWIK